MVFKLLICILYDSFDQFDPKFPNPDHDRTNFCDLIPSESDARSSPRIQIRIRIHMSDTNPIQNVDFRDLALDPTDDRSRNNCWSGKFFTISRSFYSACYSQQVFIAEPVWCDGEAFDSGTRNPGF